MASDHREVRLAPFEHYMLADDRPGHPMRFCCRLGFAGSLDVSRLTESFAAAKREHPLLTAHIERRRGRWFWAQPGELADDAPEQDKAPPASWSFDLRREAGVRFLIEPRGDDCDLWLQVHHACADARSALAFLARWFAHYEGRADPPTVPLGKSQIAALQQRDVGRHRSLWRYAVPVGMRWSRVWNFYGRRPAPLNGSNPPVPATPSTACPSYVSRRLPFDRDGWSNRKRRLSINATLNDVLLAAVFRAVGQWNERASIRPAQSWIRLAVPIDLASSDDRRAVLANYVGIVFVDRRSDRIRQHAELLAGIHEEMQSIKQQGLGFAMLDVLRILERIPYGMRAAVAPTRSMSTAVVSNLGPLDALLPHDRDLTLGRARLMEFDFLVPIRPGTAAAFGIVTYADQLHLAMNYDQQRLTANDAASLADLVCALLKDSLRPARNESALAGERQFA